MRRRPAAALMLMIGASLGSPTFAQEPAPAPPTIDCTLGFIGLHAFAGTLAGVQWTQDGGYDIATLVVPETWRAQIAFTTPGHPAHPAVTLRTQRKQVTEVWTADSKGCGYGDQSQFAILMADMKSGDTELTNASRHEVDARKQGTSILGPAP